jgi:RND family efflux transporter MFP subunit
MDNPGNPHQRLMKSGKSAKRLIYLVVFLVALGALISWRLVKTSRDKAALAAAQKARVGAPPPVTVVPAQIRDLITTYEATGTLESPLNVKLAPQVSGQITFLQVHEGDRVTKGQVLVRIDPSQIEGQVRQDEANVAEARYRLTQAQLQQTPANVQVTTQIQQMQAGVASAQTGLTQVTQNYNAQVASAQAAVDDAQDKIDAAAGAVTNAQAAVASAQAGVANATAAIASAQATTRTARANLDDASAKYQREYGLYKQGFLAAQDVDDAKAAQQVAQATLDQTNAVVDQTQAALGQAQAVLKQMQAQLTSAVSARESAVQQKQEAVHALAIAQTSGKAAIDSARSAVNQARAALAYALSNTAQTPAYVQNLNALRAVVVAAQGTLDSARAQLTQTTLVAPLDGYVTNRYMDPGAMATPGTPILGLQYFNQVWVAVAVPAEVAGQVHLGDPEQVSFDALPGQKFSATVIQNNPGGDPTSRQFTIRAVMNNQNGQLKPQMFAHVSLETQRTLGALAVPREAVSQDASGPYVMVVAQETDKTTGKAVTVAHRRPVAAGASDASYIAILQGLQTGDNVINISAFPVKDGQPVTITAAPTAVPGAATPAEAENAGGGAAPTGGTGGGSGSPPAAAPGAAPGVPQAGAGKTP